MTETPAVDEGSPDRINIGSVNDSQINFFRNVPPCQGVTLADLRIRLRNELSSYTENTLISNDFANDIERQFINDGVSVLWPHDYQIVMYSIKTNQVKNNRFILPDDCEHVFTAFTGNQDINNNSVALCGIPHHDCWTFDRSFIDAYTPTSLDGQPWVDKQVKALWVDRGVYYANEWIVVRYARKWPELKNELDCIDPTPNRINSIIFYACAQYFISQLQVNTESVRLRNYQNVANSYLQLYQKQLTLDSKPLYIL